MKFSSSSLLFGLAGAAVADWTDAGWGDASSPVAATSKTTGSPDAGTVTVVTTVTHTVKADSCGCSASPANGVSPDLGNGQGPSGWVTSVGVSPAQGSGQPGSGPSGWVTSVGVGPAQGSGQPGPGAGSWQSGSNGGGSLNGGIPDGTIIGSNSQVWTWPGAPPSSAAPTQTAPIYPGWTDNNGTGPAPGSDTSNVTTPFQPLKDGQCSDNTPADRSKWCGYSTSTNYYNDGPDTGKVCAYEWVITNTTLNYDGVPRLALAVNGQVPGPLIECNWGDTIQVSVTNKMQDNATSIHWHGVLQIGTNDQDGVPGITECALAPGDTRVYSFKARQYGTGWYHSHALSQLGDGVRGPMVIHGPATANYDIDMGTVMIDDLFGNGTNVVTAAAQNDRIAHFGPGPTWNYMLNGHNTFPDLSRGKHALWKVQPNKKHLFRLINSASQNMWSVHFDNHKMTVIAADYVPIQPWTTEWLDIGIGQRYDVIVEMNQPSSSYFLRAVTQTGCPSGCVNTGLGNANGIFQYDGAPLTLPTSSTGNKTVADFNYCLDAPLASLVPFLKLSAGSSDAFKASASLLPAGAVAQFETPDDGNVFRWFLNNGAIKVDYEQPTLLSVAQGKVNNNSISNPIILSQKGKWYYFVIQNQFFASHPMHLHGHDFSVLGQGVVSWSPALTSTLNFENPLRRDTAMLTGSAGPGKPPGYTVIGFEANNPGAWLMHCHIVWHVDGGLALQWVERPDDIPAKQYTSTSAWNNECQNVKNYFANGGQKINSGESGLKRRTYFDEMLNQRDETVVRRGDSNGKRYVEQHLKRGRHF